MWIFRKDKNREHINLETLSEYIDGRLSAGEHERVERHVEGCSRCGEELESLRYTVSLLRRMPVSSPRRIFTLGEAPPVASTPWRVRMPVWAYGAAASVSIALFALVLSADLSGSLTRDESGPRVPDQQEVLVVTTPSPDPMPDSEAARAVAVSSPTATPAPQPTSTPEVATMQAAPMVTPAPQATAMAEELAEIAVADATPLYTPAVREAASTISTPFPAPTPRYTEAEGVGTWAVTSAPTATAAPTLLPHSGDLEEDATFTSAVSAVTLAVKPTASPTAPTATAAPAMVNQLDRFEQGVTPIPTVAPSPTPMPAPTIPLSERQPAPTPDSLTQVEPALDVPSVEAEDGSTALVWHVLEGVLGTAALLIIGGGLLRRRGF